MSLKYTLAFLILSAVCLVASQAFWDALGWGALLFPWAALSFLLLSAAYAGAGPGLLFKRSSGSRSPWGWLLLGPYFVLNGLLFRIYRLFSHEPAHVQVVPGLFFGRRLFSREARDTPWTSVLDVAGEFAEARCQRHLPGYRSLPLLDGIAPAEATLRSAVTWITQALKSGPVYVHCALGHGRSACVVAAYLLSTEVVHTVPDAVRMLRLLRPGVRLRAAHRQALGAFEPPP